MNVFQDRPFCQAYNCTKFVGCRDAFSEVVRQAAERWWNKPGAPVAFYVTAPVCFTPRTAGTQRL